MSGSLRVSGTLVIRIIGVVLIVFFKEIFFGVILIVFSRRLSNALDLDEKLGQLGSSVKSRPQKSKGVPRRKPKAAPQKDRLVPCPYCGRDIKTSTRKCRHCNHTL